VRHKSTKPIASLSFDLDDKWSYLKTHGDPEWKSFPSYLDVVVPRVLTFLAERDLTITFFVVGRDAASARNAEVLPSLSSAGHELGNHSFSHEPWFHLYTEQQVRDEIERAETAIERLTGKKPVGFRGPGYSFSPTTLQVLTERGYLYDASSLPTFIGPLARMYYFMVSSLTKEELEKRDALFGSIRDGFRPIKPHFLRSDHGQLVEIPVTTMPLFRMPIHFSYILYLSGFSRIVAMSYFRMALILCSLANIRPSLLLHPLDFLDSKDAPELGFFPAIALPHQAKMEIVSETLALYARHYSIVNMQKHAVYEAAELGKIGGRVPGSEKPSEVEFLKESR
jgi:peptidoglycan-N-acetylglucosamine deacetylase